MLHIVDDDEVIRDALSWLAHSRDINNTTYKNGAAFFAALGNIKFDSLGDCLLLDVQMPDIDGFALFDKLVTWNLTQQLPVIFLTAHGDVRMAVNCLKHGAFDFFEKPFNSNILMDRVQEALFTSAQVGKVVAFKSQLEMLSVREREVLELILGANINKVIADKLGISMRTVEVHRARIFEKLNVKSAVELVTMMSSFL
ncbi:MAG: response regulator transcription factor [Burkholderiaceae bacterium]